MRIRRADRTTRRGAAVVESALVLGVFLVLLFGLFEYCRFLMVLHVTHNAARDGARFAAVNVNCPSDQIAARRADILRYTRDRMGGVDRQVEGYQVAVYPSDPVGLAQDPPRVVPKSLTANPANPFDPADPANPPWNQAAFTERIAVTVRGTYRPITPVLLFLPSAIPINVTAVVGSEG